MTLRSRSAVVLAAAFALSLAACERADAPADEPAAAEAAEAADTAPAPATPAPDTGIDATRVVDHAAVADAPPGFDVRSFAGKFAAYGAELRLAPDGTYLQVVHAESADADLETAGTWTIEQDGTVVRLDPDSKEDEDRTLRIRSRDDLAASEDRLFHRVSD